jgi:flagellar hook-associated protein 2
VDSGLRQALSEKVPGTEGQDLKYLSQVGIGFDRDGQVAFDAAKFQAVLTDHPGQVKTLLAGEGGAMPRLEETVEGLTNSLDGAIPTAIDTLESRDQRLQDQIQDAQGRVQEYDERISQQFTELEKTVQELQAVQDRIGDILGTTGGGE